MSYWILFISAFGAATLLPFYSEVTLVILLEQGYPPFWLGLTATLGNTLGAVVNWLLGRYLIHFDNRRWFPFKKEKLHRSQAWFQRYGAWSLLLAWLPIVGDTLTFIAGLMQVRIHTFILLVATGKAARYAVIILMYMQVRAPV